MEVPKLDKIVINMGVGEATQDKKRVDTAAAEMRLIAGQKPVITRAKKSIASFKLREGMPIGVQGHSAPRADVRVSRPSGHDRASARSRLSRR